MWYISVSVWNVYDAYVPNCIGVETTANWHKPALCRLGFGGHPTQWTPQIQQIPKGENEFVQKVNSWLRWWRSTDRELDSLLNICIGLKCAECLRSFILALWPENGDIWREYIECLKKWAIWSLRPSLSVLTCKETSSFLVKKCCHCNIWGVVSGCQH